MSNFLTRLLTALALIPLLVACIQWNNPVGVWLWVLFGQVAGLREWMNMTLPNEPALTRRVGVLVGAVAAVLLFWVPGPQAPVLILSGATIAMLLYCLFQYGEIEKVAARVAFLVTGVLYAAVLIAPLALFKRHPYGTAWVYVCLSVAWLSDTGAYIAGRLLGSRWPRKLYASVSPKKTVVGSVGGLLGSVLAVAVAKLWFLPVLSWADVLLVAVPANVLGQAGDLCESLIKRSVGVKDSGTLLPGHGGMLDRIDALAFAVPYIYGYMLCRFS